MNEKVAQSIAESAHEVTGYDVLVTDARGIIIGSSEAHRVGKPHEPSLLVLATGRPVATSRGEATRMQEVRPGYTAPIDAPSGSGGKLEGTISIAGPPEKVERYGRLVQKQAEIMLREQALVEMGLRREQAARDLAESVIFFNEERGNASGIFLQAQAMGYMPERWRCTLFIAGTGLEILRPGSPRPDYPNYLFAVLRNTQVVVLHPLEKNEAPRDAAALIAAELRRHGVRAAIGVGVEISGKLNNPVKSNIPLLARSARFAREALAVGLQLRGGEFGHGQAIFDAEALQLEILLASLPPGRRSEFARASLERLAAVDGDGVLRKTFSAWCANPFSPSAVARGLNIHRNTLHYRLKKIEEATGSNLWNFRDAFELWTAITLEKLA